MARPITYDKEEVIDKTMHLFWSKGYEMVSVDDIMKSTNFNRNSFYKLFGSKDGAYSEALDHYIKTGTCEVVELIGNKKGLSALKVIFNYTVEKFENSNGCLILNTLNTDMPIDKSIVKKAKSQAEEFEDIIYARLSEAKKLGEITSKKPLRTLGSIIATTLFGVRFRLKTGEDREKCRKILHELLSDLTR